MAYFMGICSMELCVLCDVFAPLNIGLATACRQV